MHVRGNEKNYNCPFSVKVDPSCETVLFNAFDDGYVEWSKPREGDEQTTRRTTEKIEETTYFDTTG